MHQYILHYHLQVCIGQPVHWRQMPFQRRPQTLILSSSFLLWRCLSCCLQFFLCVCSRIDHLRPARAEKDNHIKRSVALYATSPYGGRENYLKTKNRIQSTLYTRTAIPSLRFIGSFSRFRRQESSITPRGFRLKPNAKLRTFLELTKFILLCR